VNCATVRDVLPEFALGVAPGDDANAVELHVETCAACRKEAVDLQRAAVTFGYALAGNETPPETLEQTSSGRFTLTPPMVSMKRRNPSKSTIATWSMLMPRNFSIVRTVSLAPPTA